MPRWFLSSSKGDKEGGREGGEGKRSDKTLSVILVIINACQYGRENKSPINLPYPIRPNFRTDQLISVVPRRYPARSLYDIDVDSYNSVPFWTLNRPKPN